MPHVKYQSRDIHSREGESVLDALLRQGISIPFSCRNGICQVCLQRCTQGTIPPIAQHGLKPELRDNGYFMPCKCVPQAYMEIAPPTGLYAATLVHSKQMLSPDICKLLLEPPASFAYHAGQFINLRRADGLIRSYSLASLPGVDYFLEIHVQRKNGGMMSNWILDELKVGDALDIQGANGDCYYQNDARGQSLLLIATGTGLSPLVGIIRDALHNRHTGEIHLYHGANDMSGHYLRDDLHLFEQQHANFYYHEYNSGNPMPPDDIYAGQALDIAFARHPDLRGWHVYLAGQVDMVDSGALLAAERGAMPDAIHTDAFALRDLRNKKRNENRHPPTSSSDDKAKYPPPDAELWTALRHGELLMEVLKDFYGQVFQDARMVSFFHGVTQQRSIEKQYLFTRQILTGEKIYFGDRPRNSHHWMVISDDLFNYRSEIMLTCLRKHGLPEPMIQRYREMEEFYRHDIVKSAPFARTLGGVEVPFEGFGEITMDVGSLCDTCGREVAVGEKVNYHVRLGKIYCGGCSSQHQHDVPQE